MDDAQTTDIPIQVDGAADADLGDAAALTVDAQSPLTDPMTPTGPSRSLECGGVICAPTASAARACCTAQSDVDRRAARAANRCGVDLSEVADSANGTGCWQRDQLGTVDDRCPGLPAEPACCSDDGQCGTLETTHKLGCRHALSSEARPCSDQPFNTSCDPTGTFGFRVEVDVTWSGKPNSGLDDGRGKLAFYVLASIQGVDSATHELQATGRTCGVKLPPVYSSALCEAYLPEFPNQLWESESAPHLNLGGHYECTPASCALSLNPTNYLLGSALNTPEGPWPASAGELECPSRFQTQCFPDHDGDLLPGVQANMLTTGIAPLQKAGCANGFTYSGAPLATNFTSISNGVRRADRLLLGMRIKVGSAVRLGDDCNSGQGSALVDYVNSRAYNCFVQVGTFNFPDVRDIAGPALLCTTVEAQLVDSNLPQHEVLQAGAAPRESLMLSDRSVSHGPEVRVVRLAAAGADVSCAMVRSAAY